MEATIVCIDNSEWTRSGDYAPTRFQAQADAVNLLAGAKTQAHPENTVGVLSMAGKTPRVLVTPTPDLGKVLNCMTDIDVEPECNFPASVQIAQLALKHRQNKNQRQRIVMFVGSPISIDKDLLVKIAKKLKKNSVAVDVISFGCEAENEEKLEAFHAAVNSNGNSNLVTVPPGPVLSDVLISSPIFQGEGGSGFGFRGSGGGGGGAESSTCYLIKSNTFDQDAEVGINIVSIEDSVVGGTESVSVATLPSANSNVNANVNANNVLQSKQALLKSSRFYQRFFNTFSAKSIRLRFRNSKTTIGKNQHTTTSTSSLNVVKERLSSTNNNNNTAEAVKDEEPTTTTDLNNNNKAENSNCEPKSARSGDGVDELKENEKNTGKDDAARTVVDVISEAAAETKDEKSAQQPTPAVKATAAAVRDKAKTDGGKRSGKKPVKGGRKSLSSSSSSSGATGNKVTQMTTTTPPPPKTETENSSKQFVLHNKPPIWNEMSQVYQLDFGGRVTQESAKNFQIEYANKQVMQFGRIEANAYTLDFEWPFTTVQAFSIALANITQRLK